MLSILFAMLLAQTTFGYTKKNGTISSASVKIRSSADASSSVVGSTVKDSKVTIIGEEKDSSGTLWYQIQVNANTTGYVRGDLLKTEESSAGQSDTDTKTDSEVKQTSGTGTLIPESSNIRNAAVNGDVVITLSKGAVVTITGETTGSDSKKWYQVNFIKDSKTYTGFVRADLIDTNAQVAATSDAGTTEETPQETEAPQGQTQETANTTDCSLKSLTLSDGEISPEFSSDVTEYTITVPEGTIEIAISGVVTDEKAQITSADGFKDLLAGLNSASIVIEAEDGSSQTYHFSIIVGDISATQTEVTAPEPEVTETESFEEEPELDDTQDMVALEEYEKYKALAEKRLIYMCVLGFLLAVALVIVLNLVLKIRDLSEEDEEEENEDEDEDEDEEEITLNKPRKEKKKLFKKHEYKKLDEDNMPQLKETLTQKEQARRSEQKAAKSVFMPDLKEEAENEVAQTREESAAYEDTGLDDDFEFEFINLDVKNRK